MSSLLNLKIPVSLFICRCSMLSETLHPPQLHLCRSTMGNSCTVYCASAVLLAHSSVSCMYFARCKQTYIKAGIKYNGTYKNKEKVFLDQCCLHLAKWSIGSSKSCTCFHPHSRSIPSRPNLSTLSYPLQFETL